MLERTLPAVRRLLDREELGWLLDRVRRISVVRQESYHDEERLTIGLRPADSRKAISAFQGLSYLLLHELGHQFAVDCLSAEDRRRLAPILGDCDAPYRRLPTSRTLDPAFVSRYAMRHPLEDFAETFAVCLWRRRDPERVSCMLRERSPRCRRKVAEVERLIRRERRLAGRAGTSPGRRGRGRPRRVE